MEKERRLSENGRNKGTGRMMRMTAFLLALVMTLCTVGCGKAGNDTDTDGNGTVGDTNFEEHIEFDCTTYYSLLFANAGYDLEDDELVAWVEDKFNVTINAQAADGGDASTRVWINGETLPDMFTMYDISHRELAGYADMGAIKALPDDWEERWPNLAAMVEDCGVEDWMKGSDGKTYMIPHALVGGMTELDGVTSNMAIYYRKDWAKQIGMEELGTDGKISLSELRTYLEKVKENGLCADAYLSGNSEDLLTTFERAANDEYHTFQEIDGTYVYRPATDAYIERLSELREWYKVGLIDPDFYVNSTEAQWQSYWYGQVAACIANASPGNYKDMIDTLIRKNGYAIDDLEHRQELWDIYGVANICTEDRIVNAQESAGFWLVTGFSPNCDDATMERILYMMDYFCTEEGEIAALYGIPGEHWDYNENGNVVSDYNMYDISPSRFFVCWGYSDDAMFNGNLPGLFEYETELILNLYRQRVEGNCVPYDMNFEMNRSDAVANYSVPLHNHIPKLITGTGDINTEWQKILDDYKNVWKTALDELNK